MSYTKQYVYDYDDEVIKFRLETAPKSKYRDFHDLSPPVKREWRQKWRMSKGLWGV